MMWMPACTIRIVWPGIEPSSGSDESMRVPGDVVGADRERLALGQPAGGRGGDAARRQVGLRVAEQGARAEPDQGHVAGRATSTSHASSSATPTEARRATSNRTPRRTIG